MTQKVMACLLLALALTGLAHAETALTHPVVQGPPPDVEGHAVPGWYLGMPVLLTASMVDKGANPQSLPSMRAYVTAPVSETSASAPNREVQRPGGPVILPPHQITLTRMPPPAAPLLAVGYFVHIAADADQERVRTQPQPPNSWPQRPLASAIRVGAEWVPLNNQLAIEYGLAAGLLALQFFDVGGMMAAEFFDPAGARLGATALALEQVADAPPVDWEGNRDYRPGQIDEPAEGAVAQSGEGAPPKAVNCVACHGQKGISNNDLWPNLAGQQRGYLRAQIRAYRDGDRHDPLMTNWVRDLTDAEIDELATYYSELPTQ